MTEKKLADALVNLDSAQGSSPSDARAQAQRVIVRDRWRVKILTNLTVFFAILAAAAIIMFFYGFYYYIYPKFPLSLNQVARMSPLERTEALSAARFDAFYWAQLWSIWLTTAALVALLAAGLCTVWLTMVSRRATLRQVNAHLLEISEQLRQLRQATGK
jgi:hypothetical protein